MSDVCQCPLMTDILKPAQLRLLYQQLTGYCSSSEKASQESVDERYPNIVTNLRNHNTGQPAKYGCSLKQQNSIRKCCGHAVDDISNDCVSYVATAISLPHLHRLVSKCDPGSPISFIQWLYLQFAPTKQSAYSSL